MIAWAFVTRPVGHGQKKSISRAVQAERPASRQKGGEGVQGT